MPKIPLQSIISKIAITAMNTTTQMFISCVSQSMKKITTSAESTRQVSTMYMGKDTMSKNKAHTSHKTPLSSSTTVYLGEIFAPQLRHFPRSKHQLIIGIRSLRLISSPQVMQCELRLIRLSFFGSLYIHTFRKLPTHTPKINMKM